MIVTVAHHWQMMLVAAAIGFVLGIAFVAVYFLVAPVRLRLATSPAERTRLLRRELECLRRLGDMAAVSEEYGLAGARGLREEARLRGLLLRLALAGEQRRREH